MSPNYSETNPWSIQYPLSTAPVNVHGDMENLAVSVKDALNSIDTSIIQVNVFNDTGSTLLATTPVYAIQSPPAPRESSYTYVQKAFPNTTSPILGLVKFDIPNKESGIVVVAGVLANVNNSNRNEGDVLYVGSDGSLTNVRPQGGSGAVGIVAKAGINGIIIVEAKGNGTWGALRDGLS